MSALSIFSLLFLCAIIWFWFDSSGAREAGVKAARLACESEHLQFLDDTVSFDSLKPARNDDGQVRLRRVYKFEFSDTGNNRRNGSVVLLGSRVLVVNIGLRLVTADTVLH